MDWGNVVSEASSASEEAFAWFGNKDNHTAVSEAMAAANKIVGVDASGATKAAAAQVILIDVMKLIPAVVESTNPWIILLNGLFTMFAPVVNAAFKARNPVNQQAPTPEQ